MGSRPGRPQGAASFSRLEPQCPCPACTGGATEAAHLRGPRLATPGKATGSRICPPTTTRTGAGGARARRITAVAPRCEDASHEAGTKQRADGGAEQEGAARHRAFTKRAAERTGGARGRPVLIMPSAAKVCTHVLTLCFRRSHFGSRYKTGCCGHAGLIVLPSAVRIALLHRSATTSGWVRRGPVRRRPPLPPGKRW